MQIFHDVFSEAELEVILQDLAKERTWQPTSSAWASDLVVTKGICEYAIPNFKVEGFVRQKIVFHHPEWRRNPMKIIYHKWNVNASVGMHNDGMHAFATTFYLNKTWDANAGGLFVWEDVSGELKVVKPTFNTMVINDCYEPHMVTPVTMAATEPRFCIQVFGTMI